MHPLLRRQIKKHLGASEELPRELASLLEAVDVAYQAFEDDRAMLERSLDLSSSELLQANAGLRAVLQAFPDRFLWIEGGRLVDAGGQAAGCLPVPCGPGTDVRALSDPAIARAFTSALEALDQGAGDARFEYELPGEGAFEARLVRAADGRTLVVLRDVTAERIRQRALEEALDAAHVAMRAKGEFLAMMSHEIRTPMNAIIGACELLLGTALDAEQMEYAHVATTGGAALLAIIDDILDVSRLEAGRLELERVGFRLDQLIEDVVELVADGVCTRTRELVLEYATDVPRAVAGDPARLRQVLLNLLSNAKKFTPEGTIQLRVSVEGAAGEGPRVRFEVTDTGIGIPEDVQVRLFQPFTQADSSTTRRFGGTGLGLVISKHIVEAMGGEIGLESRPDEGSRFWFTVPLAIQGLPEPSAAEADLRGLRVLVVDDHARSREVARALLARRGAEVVAVADAAGATAAVAARAFQLALIDPFLPDADGIDLARALRDLPGGRDVALVLATAGSRGDAAAPAAAAGIRSFVAKPFRETALLHAVQAALEGGVPEAPLRAETPARLRARVLLAEDNLVNQRIAVRMLEKLGLEVDVAHNGHEAVAATSETDYDAVLMDCQMPEMDGYEATAAIRAAERSGRPRLPIVALTANAMAGDEERCLAAGMDAYLKKPIRPKDLAEALERFLLQRRSA